MLCMTYDDQARSLTARQSDSVGIISAPLLGCTDTTWQTLCSCEHVCTAEPQDERELVQAITTSRSGC